MSNITSISHEEQLGLGLGSVVHGGEIIDPDSALAMAEQMAKETGLPGRDKEGRPIISYKQYLDLSYANADMSTYALRMTHVKRSGLWTIQASKLQRWWGLGYRPRGWTPELQGRIDAVKATLGRRTADDKPRPIGSVLDLPEVTPMSSTPKRAITADSDVVVYFCNEKYPDCKRFFDTKRGLSRHWKLDHEGVGKKPPAEE